MATVVMLFLLAAILYEFIVFNHFQEKIANGAERKTEPSASTCSSIERDDIMGKSMFDVKAELRRMRQQKEKQQRNEAIAKGEMTEDGCEIAQEVKPEDCELEQKPVWKQVPKEDLPEMFEEPDMPLAKGDPLNDLDLTFGGRKNLDKEEEREVSEKMYKLFDDTVVLDDICDQAPEVGREIRRMIDKYKKEMFKTEEQKNEVEDIMQRRFSMKDRYADFNVEDLV